MCGTPKFMFSTPSTGKHEIKEFRELVVIHQQVVGTEGRRLVQRFLD